MIASESDSGSADSSHQHVRLTSGHPTTSPFPSPGSGFTPPPVPSSHEYANKATRVVRQSNTPSSAAATTTSTTTSSKKGAPDALVLSNGHADPQLGVDTSSSSSSASASAATSAQSPSLSTPTQAQTLTVSTAFPGSGLTPATPSFSHRSSSSASLSVGDLSASRIAPPSPAPSRRGSTRRRSRGAGSTSLSMSASSSAKAKSPARDVVKIRDFAFPQVDPRHIGAGIPPPDTPDSRRSSAGGWGGIRWNQIASKFSSWTSPTNEKRQSDSQGSMNMPSQSDFDRNFADQPEGGSSGDGEEASSEEGYEYGSEEGDDELRPGWYRALYAFEPEGTAEMALREDQRVRVLGRGGGVGWAVVRGLGGCALVPESYLEWVGAFAPGEEDEDEDEEEGGDELQTAQAKTVETSAQPKLDSGNGTPKNEARPLP